MSNDLVVAAACGVGFLVAFGMGHYSALGYYEKKIAEIEQAQAEALAEAEKKNAEGLSKATDTIVLAQAEYDSLRGELDRALVRLRHASSSGGTNSSADTLAKRVAQLEDLVQRLVDAGTECGRRYQRCASNHDALAEAVKP